MRCGSNDFSTLADDPRRQGLLCTFGRGNYWLTASIGDAGRLVQAGPKAARRVHHEDVKAERPLNAIRRFLRCRRTAPPTRKTDLWWIR